MAALMACGGIMGASAFFTDQAHLDGKAAMGTLNMEVTDLTDLDGDYSDYAYDQATGSVAEKISKIDAAHEAVTDKGKTAANSGFVDGVSVGTINGAAAKTAKDRNGKDGIVVGEAIKKTAGDQTSENIINPGDSGLLQFKVKNAAEKSFRTAAKISVIVKLADGSVEPDGETAATLDAAHLKDATAGTGKVVMAYPDGVDASSAAKFLMDDAEAYTLEGVGAPLVEYGHSDDGKTFAAEGTKNAMRLTYYVTLDTLTGSIEDEASDSTFTDHAASQEKIYAIEARFNRLAQNKFQGTSVDVKTDVYALQNRKSSGAWYSIKADDGKTYTNEAANVTAATGDWAQVGSFEKVIRTAESETTGLVTPQTTTQP